MSVRLRGVTWNHTRGYVPMVATAQRFEEGHPGVEIVWEKRSLKDFADLSIQEIAETLDFLVIDYPFAGNASAYGYLLPFDKHVPASFLADQAIHSVGPSHLSYYFEGHQWGLATDVAAPASSWRPDLVESLGIELPRTWEELLELARRGVVAVPAVPCDSLMNFYMLCCALGEEPGSSPARVVSEEVGVAALEHLYGLVSLCSPRCLERNPILTYEAMTRGDEIAYCPFAFCYSNYARPGYARRLLRYGGLVTFDGELLRSALGGAGLSVSSSSKHLDIALEYALYVASPECQGGLYFASGGQPGHRTAWEDPAINAQCSNFFLDVLETLDQAWVRPCYDGYVYFQEQGGTIVHRFLKHGKNPRAALQELEVLYRRGRK